MTRTKEELWERFKRYYTEFPAVGLAMDLSRVSFGDDYFEAMAGRIQKAFAAMAELENGAIANPDEKRMVGHYWLRNPALAPRKEIRAEIEETVASIKAFAAEIHSGRFGARMARSSCCCLLALAARRWVHNSLRTPWETLSPTSWNHSSLIIPTRT